MAQLAASVLSRETTEMPWGLLRHTYFSAKWDRAAARQLAQWADRHGISVSVERPGASDASIRFSIPQAAKRRVRA